MFMVRNAEPGLSIQRVPDGVKFPTKEQVHSLRMLLDLAVLLKTKRVRPPWPSEDLLEMRQWFYQFLYIDMQTLFFLVRSDLATAMHALVTSNYISATCSM